MRPVVRREPSFSEALQRLVDSTQSLAAHRMDLFRVASAEDLRRAGSGMIWRALAALAGIGAWVLLMGAAVVQLRARWDLPMVLVGVALVHLAIAGLAVGASRSARRTAPPAPQRERGTLR